MELHQRLRAALPHCTFRPPATEEQVRRVERELGVIVPPEVRRLYLHYDGFHCGNEASVEVLPLDAERPQESVLRWNQFLRGRGWQKGCEPPEHVLELGFLSDDLYIGIDLRTGEAVVVNRRGNEFEPAGRDLCDLLVQEYEDQRRFSQAEEEHVWRGREVYVPPARSGSTPRDIDRIVAAVIKARPARFFLYDLPQDSTKPVESWVLPIGYDPAWEKLRLTSPTGDCPFTIHSDVSAATTTAATVEATVATVLAELETYARRKGWGPHFADDPT